MKIDVLTLFPRMFETILGESMLKRAQVKGLVSVKVHNLRDWTSDTHKTADDKPFGGGPGMVMKIEPVYKALKELQKTVDRRPKTTDRRPLSLWSFVFGLLSVEKLFLPF